MGIDALVKRYFPVLVCALDRAGRRIFQALGHRAAGRRERRGRIRRQPVAPPVAIEPPPVACPRRPRKRRAATAILARNPFDSVTGPLDGRRIADSRRPQRASTRSAIPRRGSARATFGSVILIAASDDPEWSFAAHPGPRRSDDRCAARATRSAGTRSQAIGLGHASGSTARRKRCQHAAAAPRSAPAHGAGGQARRAASRRCAAPPQRASPGRHRHEDPQGQRHRVQRRAPRRRRDPREPGRADALRAHRAREGGRQGRRHPALRHPRTDTLLGDARAWKTATASSRSTASR